MHTLVQPIPYQDALLAYRKLRGSAPSFLLESKALNERYGRFSLLGVQPCLALTGHPTQAEVAVLSERGTRYASHLAQAFAAYQQLVGGTAQYYSFPAAAYQGDEDHRFEQAVPAQLIRSLLQAFFQDEKNYVGLYGAFAYNFVAQFEDFALRQGSVPDFRLHLYDTLLLFNHLTQEGRLYIQRGSEAEAKTAAESVIDQLAQAAPKPLAPLRVGQPSIFPSAQAYEQSVGQALELFREGELLELVLARETTAQLEGDPLALYERYRELNPAPYLFYFDFLDEQLLGASPEMMVRAEGGRVNLRPISGTARRSANPVEEHELMLELLNSPKEKSELDMLIDLGRNDLARVCEPGVQVEDYRVVEKYATLMHTVAHLSGKLRPGMLAFDALAACLNAGTLTGAPKLAAMHYIDTMEGHSRDYYGGAVGYALFNNELNTGIVIRSAHVKDGRLSYQAGATLLIESQPEAERKETELKAKGFMQVLQPFIDPHFSPTPQAQPHALGV